jgi:hypothetical protein
MAVGLATALQPGMLLSGAITLQLRKGAVSVSTVSI